MRTLVGRDAYSEIEQRFWKRGRKVMGILSVGLVIGVLTGVGFGWLWSWAMRRQSRKFFNRVYEGDAAVLGEVLPREQFASRLPCSLFVTNNVTIGGILYLGRSRVRFVPHKRCRGEQPIDLDSDGLVVWAVDWKPNWWGRTFVASGPRVLELGSGDLRYRFAVPDPDVAVPHIRDALGQ